MFTTQQADRVLLHNLSWQQFENLLVDLGDQRSVRIAYDEGTLEIMTPLPEHEYYKEQISDVIKDVGDALDMDFECYGSTTWKREMMKAGVEPDNCFYFQNEALIRGKLEFNLEIDPPPDLALEIDLTSKSLNRLPIYARLGVPEIWCYDSGKLKIYQLEKGEYSEKSQSLVFPSLNISEIPLLIEKYRPLGRRPFRQAVREWVRSQNRDH